MVLIDIFTTNPNFSRIYTYAHPVRGARRRYLKGLNKTFCYYTFREPTRHFNNKPAYSLYLEPASLTL